MPSYSFSPLLNVTAAINSSFVCKRGGGVTVLALTPVLTSVCRDYSSYHRFRKCSFFFYIAMSVVALSSLSLLLISSGTASHAVCLPVCATPVDHAALRDVAEDVLDALVVPPAFRPNGCNLGGEIVFCRLELALRKEHFEQWPRVCVGKARQGKAGLGNIKLPQNTHSGKLRASGPAAPQALTSVTRPSYRKV